MVPPFSTSAIEMTAYVWIGAPYFYGDYGDDNDCWYSRRWHRWVCD
jgi:hypothetical protein